MSINKLVSIKNAIINAQDYLGIDHDKDVPFFTNLATEAEKKIGSYWQLERKRKVIEITDCTAPIPNDAVRVEIAVMGDLGEGCGNLFNSVINGITNNINNANSNGLFLVVDISSSESTPAFGYVKHAIQDNKLIFDVNLCGQFTTIQYLALKTDCDGFLEIGQNHIEAITWYIIFRYMFRKSASNYIERDKMMMAKQEWERCCANARAMDNEPTQSQHLDMVRMFNNPYSGIGLWQGMNSTLGVNYNIW